MQLVMYEREYVSLGIVMSRNLDKFGYFPKILFETRGATGENPEDPYV